ncbi:RNA polymerase sigma factor [Rariglobus hedericola]|uniref:Sigma-70 family RNA polymerase sigma factor n=1 Tax=Rariglobus hedericola TaxID=2597822 RepID=A0A556QL58_9BACT|nr:sigma-70 family RNA polymerase sigma factor [Rariglobus hedericola]TSJ77357.1 sigma-70 family RNA polymerase sigma factor [Rariglobus hedericola]
MTPAASLPTDEALMAELARGSDPALDELMHRWQIPLRSFLYRYTQNEADALDLSQETFVRIYRHRDRYREGAKFSTWLFQIALNQARDHARHRLRRPTDSMDRAPELFSDTHSPAADLLLAERSAAVRTAIADLPEHLRSALVLFEYEEKSHAEIAAIVSATPKAVETRLARARELLRKKLVRWMS